MVNLTISEFKAAVDRPGDAGRGSGLETGRGSRMAGKGRDGGSEDGSGLHFEGLGVERSTERLPRFACRLSASVETGELRWWLIFFEKWKQRPLLCFPSR